MYIGAGGVVDAIQSTGALVRYLPPLFAGP